MQKKDVSLLRTEPVRQALRAHMLVFGNNYTGFFRLVKDSSFFGWWADAWKIRAVYMIHGEVVGRSINLAFLALIAMIQKNKGKIPDPLVLRRWNVHFIDQCLW